MGCTLNFVHKMKELKEQAIFHGKVFTAGLRDTIAFAKLRPTLLASPELLEITILSVVVAVSCATGLAAMYYRGVLPVIGIVTGEKRSLTILSHLSYSIYHANWILPLSMLCYCLCLVWYQEIGRCYYKYTHRLAFGEEIKSCYVAEDGGLWSTAVWLLYVAQTKITSMVPSLVASVAGFVLSFFFSGFLFSCLSFLLRLMGFLGQLAGLVLLALSYGWYAFQPHWITQGIPPRQRYLILQSHFAYFIGFGLPYAAVVTILSFPLGLCLQLVVFPLAIVLAGLSDYEQPYLKLSGGPSVRNLNRTNNNNNAESKPAESLNPDEISSTQRLSLPFFKYPESFATQIVSLLDVMLQEDTPWTNKLRSLLKPKKQ